MAPKNGTDDVAKHDIMTRETKDHCFRKSRLPIFAASRFFRALSVQSVQSVQSVRSVNRGNITQFN